MKDILESVLPILQGLLPGFLAAWVFYGLTPHKPKDSFERVVQALIFNTIIQSLVIATETCLVSFGTGWDLLGYRIGGWALHEWSPNVEFVWSVIQALLLGHMLALFANKNWYHRLMTKCQVTRRNSHPSEWFSAFNRYRKEVVLHLKSGRRLLGWPIEWPDHPNEGHFVITDASWILDSNEPVPLIIDEAIMLAATEVEMIEFLKGPDEVVGRDRELLEAIEVLTEENRKFGDHTLTEDASRSGQEVMQPPPRGRTHFQKRKA